MVISSTSIVLGLIGLFLARDFFQAIPASILYKNTAAFQLAGQAYMSEVIDTSDRSKMIGFYNGLGEFTWSTGSVIGGLIIGATGFHIIIPLSTIFPIISILIIVFFLRDPAHGRGEVYVQPSSRSLDSLSK